MEQPVDPDTADVYELDVEALSGGERRERKTWPHEPRWSASWSGRAGGRRRKGGHPVTDELSLVVGRMRERRRLLSMSLGETVGGWIGAARDEAERGE
jgi:hypothetical protein